MLIYECLMIMLMLCKSSYARLTPRVLQPADIHIGREIAGKLGNSKKVVMRQTHRFGQVWTEMVALPFVFLASAFVLVMSGFRFGFSLFLSIVFILCRI